MPLLLIAAAAGCRQTAVRGGDTSPAPLRVATGPSTDTAMLYLLEAFEESHSGVEVDTLALNPHIKLGADEPLTATPKPLAHNLIEPFATNGRRWIEWPVGYASTPPDRLLTLYERRQRDASHRWVRPFLRFVYSERGQAILAELAYAPLEPEVLDALRRRVQ